MDIRQLRNFLAVVNFQNFSQAAAHIGKSQQALSKSVRELEHELGMPLLTRSGKAVRLTNYGQRVAASARVVDFTLLNLQQKLHAEQSHERERVRLGVSPTTCGLVCEALLALTTPECNLRFDVLTGAYTTLSHDLLNGELDLFVCLTTHDEIDISLFQHVLPFRDEYRVIAASTHPLAQLTHVTPHQLAEYHWILGRSLGEIDGAWRLEFERARIKPPDSFFETNSVGFTRSILIASEYLTILPVHLIEFELEARVLACVDTIGFSWTRPVAIYYRRGSVLSPGTMATIESLEHASKKYARGSITTRA